MNENTRLVAHATVAAAIVGLATANYIKTVRTERMKRAKIKLQLEKDLTAIWRAGDAVKLKAANGDYTTCGLAAIQSDLEFYRMVNHPEF